MTLAQQIMADLFKRTPQRPAPTHVRVTHAERSRLRHEAAIDGRDGFARHTDGVERLFGLPLELVDDVAGQRFSPRAEQP